MAQRNNNNPPPNQNNNPLNNANNPNNQANPIDNLAQQIRALVAHMQQAPAPQINMPAPQINIPQINILAQQRELNLTEETINKLTEAIDKMMAQYKEARKPPKRNWNSWNNRGSRGPCLCCGQNGHFARDCPNPLHRDNNRNVATGANATPFGQNSNQPTPSEMTPLITMMNESQAFLNLHDEDTLYNIGEEREQPIRSTRLKRQRPTEGLSQKIYPDLQEVLKAPAAGELAKKKDTKPTEDDVSFPVASLEEDWWDMDGEDFGSSDVCSEDRINEIYDFYFDDVEEVAPEIDIRELEEKDRDQLHELLKIR
ncbi:5582_t:CDS:2 [Racocetra fulgida]|uniref:5582_t:CDS:1 n=1 Tax=Racocetra fulgida TaxID=60492 RepID=A0A9N8VEN7_9GLOM|nr:5582_t:CDS:2 [Racocetra fulgida]